MGTLNVLEGARYNYTKKFLYAASSSCYGIAKTLLVKIIKLIHNIPMH